MTKEVSEIEATLSKMTVPDSHVLVINFEGSDPDSGDRIQDGSDPRKTGVGGGGCYLNLRRVL